MAVFRCKMCGGDLDIKEGQAVCTCEFCGTEQTLPRLDSEKKTNLYDRASHFRRNNEFDKAMGIYEQILNEDGTDSEAYWSLVLCRYGIEYVEDPATHKRIPTVNRAQYTSIYADEDYKSAIEYADAAQKIIYEQEAGAIDEIQKGILAISAKEEPFDVFICYKETDDSGRRTPDSVLANDLYHQLTQEGFKVFFARITLEDKLGQEYEPYIFAALNSAKVMVVLGTRPEYFKAVWVKNEWARYLALIRKGEKKMLVPAYKDMDPYDLPEEFSYLQAQDMAKLGFMQDLIRGIKKIVGADQPKAAAKEAFAAQKGGTGNSKTFIKRGNMALEDGEWKAAEDFFEEALNQDPECAEAYMGKLLVKYKCKNIETLTEYFISRQETAEKEKLEACAEETERIEKAVDRYREGVADCLEYTTIRNLYNFNRYYESELPAREQQKEQIFDEFSKEKLFVRAGQYASGELRNRIDQMLADITSKLNERIEKARKEDGEKTESIKAAYIRHLDEADKKAGKLRKEALDKKEAGYQSALAEMEAARGISDFEKLVGLFQGLNGYKDTDVLAVRCQKEVERIREKKEKKKKRKIRVGIAIAIFFASAILIVLKLRQFDESYCGTDGQGKNVKWSYNVFTGIHTINGNGQMAAKSLESDFDIKNVYIENGVTNIGNGAFEDCKSLTSITIPGSVTSIGESAFAGCESLTSITIPGSVTSIGESAFAGCESLTSITIPGSVTSIEDYAFSRCEGLTSITIPESVTSIGEYAFFSCGSITSITIPESVTSIKRRAFAGCESITSIIIPESVTSIGGGAFFGCKNLTSITIPESVTSIGVNVFAGCKNLTSITIPESVTSIGKNAFFGCKSLSSITIPGKVSIGEKAFEGCKSLTITIPDGVPSIGEKAFAGFEGLTSITIPDSVTYIYKEAFAGCKDLTSITIPDSVISIGEKAFAGCEGLTSITIPDSVRSIGEKAFSGCGSLTSITIPDSVRSIGVFAFADCESLTSITIPDSVIVIGGKAFEGCKGLTSATIPDTVRIADNAFDGCTRLTDIRR